MYKYITMQIISIKKPYISARSKTNYEKTNNLKTHGKSNTNLFTVQVFLFINSFRYTHNNLLPLIP